MRAGAHAAALIRHLRALRLATPPRRGPLPRQQRPDAVALAYYRALEPHIARVRLLKHDQDDILRLLLEELHARGEAPRGRARADAPARREQALAVVNRTAARAARDLRPDELHAVARQFGQRASRFQQEQLDRQLRHAMGVPFSAIEAPTRDRVEGFAALNVDLIKTVPDRYFDRLRLDVEEAFEHGDHPEDLADSFVERYGMAEDDARRIARDQIGKLTAQVNQDRQEALGVEAYVWRSMRDSRVRDEHAERDGEIFQWDDPPEDGHPGEAIQCFPGDVRTRLFNARVQKTYRRRYVGPLVVLTTSTQEILRATPNHPVLTRRGWLPAHLIEVDEHVFQAPTQRLKLAVDDPQSGDSMFEELFGASTVFGPLHDVACFGGGFHGDVSDEKVDVVDIDRGLQFEGDFELSQSFCQKLFARADATALPLRGAHLLLMGPSGAPRGVVRGACKLLSLFGAHVPMTLEHRRRAVAWLDSLAKELAADGCAADVELFRQSLHAVPFDVEPAHHVARVLLRVWRRTVDASTRLHSPSAEELGQAIASTVVEPQTACGFRDGRTFLEKAVRVVQKIVGEFDGHVYNLETSSGWYVAQNLIVHNCRCYAEPILTLGSGEESEE